MEFELLSSSCEGASFYDYSEMKESVPFEFESLFWSFSLSP
jgi:hypothetical protein